MADMPSAAADNIRCWQERVSASLERSLSVLVRMWHTGDLGCLEKSL